MTLALEQLLAPEVLALVEGVQRESVGVLLADQRAHGPDGVLAVENAADPGVHRAVRRVHALPDPVVEVGVARDQPVVQLARRPMVGVRHVPVAQLPQTTGQVPDVVIGVVVGGGDGWRGRLRPLGAIRAGVRLNAFQTWRRTAALVHWNNEVF